MKRRICISIIVSLLIVLVYSSCSNTASISASSKEQVELGNKYLQEGKYEEAVLAFNKAIEIEPKNIDARIGLGKAYIATGKLDMAEAILKEALDIDPKNMEARVKLSESYVKGNNISAAEEILKKAMEIDSKNPQVYIELANLYVKQNKLEDALKLLEKGYELTKDEGIKKLLDELKKQSEQSKTQGKQTDTPSQTPSGGKSIGNYIQISSGISISQGDASMVQNMRNSNPSMNIKSAISVRIAEKQMPQNIQNDTHGAFPIWKKTPVTNEDISKHISKEDHYRNISKHFPAGMGLPIYEEGSYYVCIVFYDKDINVIGVYQSKDPLPIKIN